MVNAMANCYSYIQKKYFFLLFFLFVSQSSFLTVAQDSAVGIDGDNEGANSVVITFQEGVNSYNGTFDTFLSTINPNNTHETSEFFEWDLSESGASNPSYGLLRFENIFGAGASQIPNNANIISATLEYTVTTDPGNQGTVKEATSDWDESSTFNNFPGDPLNQGSTVATAPGTAGTHSIDVTSSLVDWSNGTSTNKGGYSFSSDYLVQVLARVRTATRRTGLN